MPRVDRSDSTRMKIIAKLNTANNLTHFFDTKNYFLVWNDYLRSIHIYFTIKSTIKQRKIDDFCFEIYFLLYRREQAFGDLK